jgi:hypothetical protein
MLRKKLLEYSVLLLAIAALLIPIVWIEQRVLQDTHGILTYPLDGAFLHMTVAKHLAFDGVWGITKYSFHSVAVSPLYTVLLAVVFFVMGDHLIIPLLVNGAAAIYCLVVMQQWLIRQGLKAAAQLLILLAVVILTPLPLLVISGTSQTLQLLLSFLFLSSFFESVQAPTPLPRSVYIYGLLMVASYDATIDVAWLVGCGLVLLGPLALKYQRWWLVLAIPLFIRSVIAFGITRQSFIGMYDRQYQLAKFVHTYYYKRHIAFNEIGAISYYSEGRKLDLTGKWSPVLADSLSRQYDMQIAILSNKDPNPRLPAGWGKIASWEIPNAAPKGTDGSVSFYSIDTAETATLRKNLLQYQKSLPAGVSVRYY